ncbi:MAG TPA: hypothetical protein VKV74_13700 [Bryobacteraceae bacterium]|nr:hypothetical protein [Bryobacteraceae bacterium]
MFARALAAGCCLLDIALCSARAESVNPQRREVVVYLKTAAAQPVQPVEEMKREASALLEPAGYTLTWRNLSNSAGEVVDVSLVVVELRGVCRAPGRGEQLPLLLKPASLASTSVVNGDVLPFSWLECGILSRMLSPALIATENRRDYLYGRAMGRLIGHELFHILTNTRQHDSGGVAKPYFSAQDLLGEHFEFEPSTLARFHEAAVDATEDAGEALEQAGR